MTEKIRRKPGFPPIKCLAPLKCRRERIGGYYTLKLGAEAEGASLPKK